MTTGKNSIMKWILLILVFLLLFLFSTKLEFRLYKREIGIQEVSIVIIFLFWRIKLKTIDLGRYLERTMRKYSISENARMTLSQIKLMIANNHLIQKYLKQVTIEKITIIPRWNSENPSFYALITVMNWNIISTTKYILDTYFKKVNNEYYAVEMNDESKKGINMEIIASITIFKLLLVTILNLKQIIKIMKKEKQNGRAKTNQSTTSNSNGLPKRIN